MSEEKLKANIMKPILTDELLSKCSLEKQIALLKAERNTYLSALNIGDLPFSGLVRVSVIAQGIATIDKIIRSKEVEGD